MYAGKGLFANFSASRRLIFTFVIDAWTGIPVLASSPNAHLGAIDI